jgi:hypothetical protein
LSDPVYCCFTCWSRCFCHNYLSFLLYLINNLSQVFHISGRGCRVTCCFISFITRVNLYIWIYELRGKASKQPPVCQFFSTGSKASPF